MEQPPVDRRLAAVDAGWRNHCLEVVPKFDVLCDSIGTLDQGRETRGLLGPGHLKQENSMSLQSLK